MTAHTLTRPLLLVLLSISMAAAPLQAARLRKVGPETRLHKAYYLEHSKKAYAEARRLYEAVLHADPEASIKRDAVAGAARCRDQLAAKNFATLMPPDTMIYVELNRPGEVLEKMAGMLGLTRKDMHAVLANRPDAESLLPFHLPGEIAISPAVFDALGCFGGAAAAFTSFDPSGNALPTGVLVIHHGDFKLFKGILETAFQFFPTAKKIKDMPTFTAPIPELGQVSGVLTDALFIVGTSRGLVEGVVDRLVGAAEVSLATRDDLAEVFTDRPTATLFAYADLQGIFDAVKADLSEHDLRDFNMVNAFADLDSLRWASFSLGIDDGALGAQLAVRLADGHRSLAYNLMRLPPMSRDCLRVVPPNAAAFVGLGLNPAWADAAISAAGTPTGDTPAITGFDIGRELFGNIREVCAFVIPGDFVRPKNAEHIEFVPNVGIVLSVNDAAKSRALWDQLLTIPGLIGPGELAAPRQTKIGRTPSTVYAVPELGKIYLAELDHCIAIGLTRKTLKASIRAHNKNKSILDDEVMGKVIAQMPRDSSIMLAAHIGRATELGIGGMRPPPGISMMISPITKLCRNTVAWIGLGQSPNQLTFRGAVGGLPNINEALKEFAPMINSAAAIAAPMTRRHDELTTITRIRTAHDKSTASNDEEEADDEDEEDDEDEADEVDEENETITIVR